MAYNSETPGFKVFLLNTLFGYFNYINYIFISVGPVASGSLLFDVFGGCVCRHTACT